MYCLNIIGTSLLLLQLSNALPATSDSTIASGNGFKEFYASHTRRDLPQGIVLPLTRGEETTRIQRRIANSTGAPLTAVQQNLLADVSIGGQTFKMLVDTGSSDTWVAVQNFSCVSINEKPTSQATCNIPSTYTQPTGTKVVDGVRLSQGYASKEFVTGPMVLETVSVGGVTMKNSQVGAVKTAFWRGDGLNSGLLGLAGPVTTTAQDAAGKQAVYNPIFQVMIQQNVSKPFFSMALEVASTGPAGFLTFGGLPPVAHEDNFTTVPIIKASKSFQGPLPSPQVVDFLVATPQFTVDGKTMEVSKLNMVVDSGTFSNVVPDDVANKINALWTPPATFNDDEQLFKIDCAATMPDVGVNIGGKSFQMKSAAAVQKNGTSCISGWAGGGSVGDAKATFILGDVFMRSVVSVFDLGTGEMHFAARK